MSKMKSETEIIEKRTDCFYISWNKQQDKNEEGEANYYSGAWHALLWVLGEDEDI